MCLAVPGKIIDIQGDFATIDYDGIRKRANVSLIEAEEGDYVLVHAGFAIEKVREELAIQNIDQLKEYLKDERSDR